MGGLGHQAGKAAGVWRTGSGLPGLLDRWRSGMEPGVTGNENAKDAVPESGAKKSTMSFILATASLREAGWRSCIFWCIAFDLAAVGSSNRPAQASASWHSVTEAVV